MAWARDRVDEARTALYRTQPFPGSPDQAELLRRLLGEREARALVGEE